MKKTLTFVAALLLCLCAVAQPKDTTRVLCIGNSFTYHCNAHEKLAEISLSEGHFLKLKAAYVGGYTFNRHLNDIATIKAIEVYVNPYEYVFLQNQSQVHALYGQNPRQHKLQKQDAIDLVARVRQYSPAAHIYMESTWAYSGSDCGGFSSVEEFDRLLVKGTAALAKATRCDVSPIGAAFATVRAERPDVNLLDKDNKHQGEYGAYLKACVNYLLIFGQKFSSEASCCQLDTDICAYLRDVAERTILK